MTDTQDRINLKINADAAFTQIIRLATFMVASRMDFDISRIEDLRIAVDESSNYAILNSAEGGSLNVTIMARSDELEILISFKNKQESVEDRSDLGVFSRMILESVLDGFELSREGEFDKIRLKKNRQ